MKECTDCGGKGKIPLFTSYVKCDSCGGTGHKNLFVETDADLYATFCSLIDAGAKDIVLNKKDYKRAQNLENFSATFKVETRGKLLNLGLMATLHGAAIFVNSHVSPGTFWGYSEHNRYPYAEVGSERPPNPVIIAGSDVGLANKIWEHLEEE